ncbi:MAG: DUF4116 domain-containing protein, partial [Desulfovibrio sp.]|nr:DUF4116 domain-containing protein [Desulfovibrio sp.]
KTATQRVWREQVTYDMSAIRTGLRLFRASPGLERQFFATGGAALTMDRWVYDEKKIVVLRLSPATGEVGAGISRLLLRGYYQAVYDRGLGLPEGQCTFLLADEFQDFISTDPTDALNDAAFVAKVREFRCAVLLGTQSAIALAQRAIRGISDVRTILGNCNIRIFMYSDEPETVSLAPASETPLDALGPGQAVLVHYDVAARTHRHATTGVNGMHNALQPVLVGADRGQNQIVTPAPYEEERERVAQDLLVGGTPDEKEQERTRKVQFAGKPAQSASTPEHMDTELVEESPAETAMSIVQSRGADLAYVPEAHRAPEICLAAVHQDGLALRFVPEALKTPEICLAAVRNHGMALEWVPEALKTSDLCLEAVRQRGRVLRHVPESLKTPLLCMEAVRSAPWAMQDVPASVLTGDLCLVVVQNDGGALEIVPDGFRTPDVCMAAVQNNGAALQFVPQRLRTAELCLVAVRNDGLALRYVPEALKTAEICLEAVRRSSVAIDYLPAVPAPARHAPTAQTGVASGRSGGSRQPGLSRRLPRRRPSRQPSRGQR